MIYTNMTISIYWILLDITGYPAAIWPSNAKNPQYSMAKRRCIGKQNLLKCTSDRHGPISQDIASPFFFLIPASSNCQSTKHPLTTPWLSGKKTKKHVSVSFSKFVRRFDQPYVHTLTALVPCTRDAREA